MAKKVPASASSGRILRMGGELFFWSIKSSEQHSTNAKYTSRQSRWSIPETALEMKITCSNLVVTFNGNKIKKRSLKEWLCIFHTWYILHHGEVIYHLLCIKVKYYFFCSVHRVKILEYTRNMSSKLFWIKFPQTAMTTFCIKSAIIFNLQHCTVCILLAHSILRQHFLYIYSVFTCVKHV